MIHYRRTQVSWPAVVPMAAAAVVFGGAFLSTGAPHAPAMADDGAPDSMPIFAFVVVGIGVAVVALAAWMIYAGMQPPTVQVTADGFSVGNGPYSNTVPFRRITAVSLDDHLPRVRGRTNGFAAGDTLRGTFRVDTWGSARLYVNLHHPPFVVVRSHDGFVAVNFANPQQTRDVYAELRQALDRSR